MPRVGRIEATGDAGRGQRDVEHRDPGRGITRRVRAQFGIQPQEARALGEQRAAAEDDDGAGKRELRECEAEIRADAGGFTRGDGEGGAQSLYST